jgi:hypothetical protein
MLMAFLGFVVHVLNSWFRRRLESGVWPISGKWPVSVQQKRLQELQDRVQGLRPDMVNYRIEVRDGNWDVQLGAARVRGRAAARDGSVRQDTLTGIDAMEVHRAANQGIPFAEAAAAFDLLRADLEQHDADTLPDLNRAQIRFRELAGYGYDQADSRFRKLNSDRQSRFPRSAASVGPTALANLTAAHADGILSRYGMNVEIFWPEIQKFAAADPVFKDGMEESKLRVDFAVAMVATAILYTAAWLALLLLAHGGRLAICAVAVLGPAVAIVFSQIAVWNTQAFHSTVNTAIELYRFQVLAALHCDLPAGAAAERALWTELTKLAELGDGAVRYRHA